MPEEDTGMFLSSLIWNNFNFSFLEQHDEEYTVFQSHVFFPFLKFQKFFRFF